MSQPRREHPRPGRLVNFILRHRIDPAHWARLHDELLEMHEHRKASADQATADRWLRREYRRLAWRLVTGARLDGAAVPTRPAHGHTLSTLWQDVRHSLRGLARAPMFTAAIVGIVGLGIGGTSLVFAIVHSVLISPLPYPDGDRMVLLRTVQGEQMWGTSMADVHALSETPPEAFEGIAAYSRGASRIQLGPNAQLINTKWVTPGYFPLLGHEPVSGRHFTEEEGLPGGTPAVLITEGFRLRSYDPDTDVIGRTLLVDGDPRVVVGVLPDRLGPLDRVIEVFPSLVVDVPPRKGPFFYPMIGRVRDGVAPDVARTQLAAVSERIFPIWQNSFTQRDAVLGFIDLKQALVGNVERTLLMVLTAVAFLLIIASANASSLLVARGITRAREIGIRAALGASKSRVARLLLTEAGVIATAAAAFGLLTTVIGLESVKRLGIGRLPRVEEIGLNAESVTFFLAVTFGSWLLFGVVAGVATIRSGTRGVAVGGRGSTASRGMLVLRRTLAAVQFAVTIPMLVGAGLLIESLQHVQSESFGFDPEGVVSMLVTLPRESFPNATDVREFWATTLPEIEALPGVVAAGVADARPPMPIDGGNNFVLEDQPAQPGDPSITAPWITADPGFFRTLGLRVLEGRIYDPVPSDTMRHALVDESWVARFYPDRSAVGRRFRSGGCTVEGCPWVEIVGVVQDVKTSGLDDTRKLGTMYYDFARDSYQGMRLHVRARGDALGVVPAVRLVLAAKGEGIPVGEVRTVEDLASESLTGRRYTSTLVALLAVTALLLSVVGIYGVMAHYVKQHLRDIGIRIALGGGPTSALRMVLKRGMAVAGVGSIVGLLATPSLTRPLSDLLYGVQPGDPLVMSIVAAGTLAVAFVATVLPGRQAARTDPAETLREE
ncbi:MAG: FtsX-like permease family protein [Gemmatimonadetes bacterium]|nr:FtsX-like permease family protein [Gemmatimonadota bacterium]